MTTEIIGEGYDLNKHRNMRIFSVAPLLLLAFVLSIFLYQLFCVYSGKYFGFNYVFYYWGSKFTSRPSLPNTRYMIYYGLCIFYPIAAAYISLKIYDFLKKIKGFIKLFFFWFSVFNLNIIFMEIFSLPFNNNSSIGQFLAYADLQIYILTIFFLISIGAFWFFGMLYVRYLLQSSNTTYYIRYRKRRRKYVLQTAIIPWLLSFAAGMLFFYPETTNEHFFLMITTGLFIGVMWFYCYHKRNRATKLYKHDLPKKISYVAPTILAFIYLIFHFILANGVHVM